MKLTRTGKLIRNLTLCVLILFLFWELAEQPLPLRWDYRRTENAYFLEPKEILLEKEDEIISRDRGTLYHFSDGTIQSAPIEDGVAWLVLPQWGRVLTILAFDETGTADHAFLRYTVAPDHEDVTLVYEVEAAGENGLFFLPVVDQYEETVLDATETMYKRDISEYLRGMSIYSTVRMELILYDTAGEEVHNIEFEADSQ